MHQQLSSVAEEGGESAAGEGPEAGSSGAEDEDEEEGFGQDPMAATTQAVLASCATVTACGSLPCGSLERAGLKGSLGGGGGGAPRPPSRAADEVELASAAVPSRPAQDARGVLRAAAVALGRSLSYRPSLQLSGNFDLLAAQGSLRSPAGSRAELGSPDASPFGAGERPALGALTKSVSMRPHRSLPMAGGDPLTAPSRSLVVGVRPGAWGPASPSDVRRAGYTVG